MKQIDISKPDADVREFRNALGRFPTGVAIVTTSGKGTPHVGVTVNSFAAVSLDPPLVLWSLRTASASRQIFADNGHFIVHLLGLEQAHLCHHFSTPAPDKFSAIEHDPGIGGCPKLLNCLAAFECETVQQIESGDHIIFIGRVVRACYRDGDPLVFAGGQLTALRVSEPIHAAA